VIDSGSLFSFGTVMFRELQKAMTLREYS